MDDGWGTPGFKVLSIAFSVEPCGYSTTIKSGVLMGILWYIYNVYKLI
jgi:hypothetical protein